MEFENIKIIEKTNSNNKDIWTRFDKSLKNLLAIKSRGDNSIFMKINKSTSFDLFNILKWDDLHKIMSKSSFSIKIPRISKKEFIAKINEINNIDEMITFLEDNNIKKMIIDRISYLKEYKEKKNIDDYEEWDDIYSDILYSIDEQIKNFNVQWNRFIKKANDIYEQTNIWPLYVNTYFIKGNLSKPIYAPLICKEIEIINKENDFYIQSKNETLLINEKISFILEEELNWTMAKINEEKESISIDECSKELDVLFKEIIKKDKYVLIDKFERLNSSDIDNNEIILSPGIVLSISNPVGSNLRKALIDLIQIGKINENENLLAKNLSSLNENNLIEKIINQEKIARICKTDLSQEKAIISSLDRSTIIIGPPGTGKSQTISNIITNILYNNKTALFISQKRVALEVVLDRLQDLKWFTLQLSDYTSHTSSGKKEKEWFYKNLSNWRKYVEEFTFLNFESSNEFNSLISKELIEYWNSKDASVSVNDIEIFSKLKNTFSNFDQKIINFYAMNKEHLDAITNEEWEFYLWFYANIVPIVGVDQILNFNLKIAELFNIDNIIIAKSFETKVELSNLTEEDLLKIHLHKKSFQNISWEIYEKIASIENVSQNKDDNFVNLLNSFVNLLLEFKKFNLNINIDNIFFEAYSKLNKKQFAKKFNFQKSGFLFNRDYPKEFFQLYEYYQNLILFITKYNIEQSFLQLLLNHKEFIVNYHDCLSIYLFIKQKNIDILMLEKIKSILDVILEIRTCLEFIKNYNIELNQIIHIKTNKNYFMKIINDLNLYNYLHNLNLKEFLYLELLKSIENVESLTKLEINFVNYHQNEVPKVNDFIENNDKNKVLKQLIKNFNYKKERLSKEEQQLYQRLIGRINRQFTKPSSLISLFKDIFKKFFNITVGTPENLASYVDFMNDHYDYIIFDESSQIFLEKALPFIALGDKIIIAGDNQQMQPSNWFTNRVATPNEELEDENIDSLLEYAINSGIKSQYLELNYRSNFANLTTFSSKHFYESNLKCLDKLNNNSNSNSIQVIDVGGEWIDSCNEKEARKMIEILNANLNLYNKIILLTLNSDQLKCLDEIISLEYPELYRIILNTDQIILKSLENIQGDEADLVIISVAYTNKTKLAQTYVCRPNGKNALNVAITRAKDKMIVIKSISSNDIISTNQGVNLFKEWLSFIDSSTDYQKTYSINKNDISRAIDVSESSFEEDVIKWLSNQTFSKPIKLIAQFPVGSYRIDVALFDKSNERFILGIEIDGYRYHSSNEQKYHDLIRQNFIESKGYSILRIPEIRWKTKKEKILFDINKHIDLY